MLCTHASALIDIEMYKSICIVKKDDESIGTKGTDELFIGDSKKDFNLSYWINPDRSELFFAKRVILVEGPTDKTIIPLLAKVIGVFKDEYTLVDCGSKDNIPLYCQLLNKFYISYVAVYDKDHQKLKKPNAITSADKSSALIEKSIDGAIGSSVILVNDIEEEIGMAAGGNNKPYAAVLYVSSPEFSIPGNMKAIIQELYQ